MSESNTEMIKRLRAQTYDRAVESGAVWAQDFASLVQLEALSEIEQSPGSLFEFADQIGVQDFEGWLDAVMLTKFGYADTPQWVGGFIAGATEKYGEVRDEVFCCEES